MHRDLQPRNSVYWPANTGWVCRDWKRYVYRTLTLPLNTSTRASHLRSWGKSPRLSQSSLSALTQYASCSSLIFFAVLYLRVVQKCEQINKEQIHLPLTEIPKGVHSSTLVYATRIFTCLMWEKQYLHKLFLYIPHACLNSQWVAK